MTACANNNEGKAFSGKKAVSATLAGVLAVGMVPAAALATEAPTDGADEAGIDLLASNQDVLDKAVVTGIGYTNGTVITTPGDIEISKIGVAELGNLALHSIKFENGTELKDLENGGNATFTLEGYGYALADGSYDNTTDPKTWVDTLAALFADKSQGGFYEPNKVVYAAFQIGGDNAYNGEYYYVPFTMVSKSLEGAFLIENGNIADTSFCWTGNVLDLGIALNDTVLTKGTDYSVKVFEVGADVNGTQKNVAGEELVPGKYVAKIQGEGDYDASSLDITFTVGKLDLSQTTVFVKPDALSGATAPGTAANDYVQAMYIDGSPVNLEDFEMKYVSGPDGEQGLYEKLGAYTYEIVPNDDIKNRVENTKQVTIDKIAAAVGSAHFKYDGVKFGAGGKDSIATDYDSSNPDFFDVNDIKVTNSNGTEELPFVVKVYDQYYNEASVEDLKTNGTWYVYVAIDSAATGYKYGGMSNMMTVTVTGAHIDLADVVFSYDGENMSTAAGESTDVTYDGTDLFQHVKIVVKDKKGNVLTQGEDYQVTIKDQDGKIVDEIVDAGTYTIAVTSSLYDIQGDADVVLKVAPARIASIDVTNTVTYGDAEFFEYTGEAITPEFSYATTNRPTAGEYKALPDVYDVEYLYTEMEPQYDQHGYLTGGFVASLEKVSEMKEKGTYILVLHPDEEAEGVTNFLFDGFAGVNNEVVLPHTVVTVSDAKVFADVPTSHWASHYVFDAAENGYINGYAGTKLFRPDAAITRADAVVVLYNMAGGNVYNDNLQNAVFDYMGWTADFADVDTHAYYMAALSWAQKIGLVTGYDGTDNFGPNDQITREQFATMLGRYAEMTGEDISSADVEGELAQYPDAAQIDGYAKAYVAWLSEQGIMTGDKGAMAGYMLPDNDVTRAEVAKMAVCFQPERVESGLI